MSSVTIEDHGNQQYGLRITNSGRAKVDSNSTLRLEREFANKTVYAAEHFELDTADDAYNQMLLVTGSSKQPNLFVEAYCGGDSVFELYQGPATPSSSGTEVTAHHMNRGGSAVTDATVYHTPTGVSASGIQLCHKVLPAGAGVGAIGLQMLGQKYILNTSTRYLISLQNIAGGAQPTSVRLMYYEE